MFVWHLITVTEFSGAYFDRETMTQFKASVVQQVIDSYNMDFGKQRTDRAEQIDVYFG